MGSFPAVSAIVPLFQFFMCCLANSVCSMIGNVTFSVTVFILISKQILCCSVFLLSSVHLLKYKSVIP